MLGPSIDGGYWLVGQRQPGRDLFTGVPWSSPMVLRTTRAPPARRTAHRTWSCHPCLDVDTISDLESVAADSQVDETLRRSISELVWGRGGT